MAQYNTYDQQGLKEDVSDIIADISPLSTPCYTMFKEEKINARTFSWLEDSLPDAGDNALIEGGALSAGATSHPDVHENQTQILSKTFEVTATADAVGTYGRAKETAYQLSRALKSIKRDVEFAMVGDRNTTQAQPGALDEDALEVYEGSASSARKMKQVMDMIDTTVDAGSSTTAAVMTEDDLLELAQECYENGSEPDTFMITPGDARVVADFATASGRERDFGQSKTIVMAVDIMVTPFGTFKTVLNRHMDSSIALLIDPSMFRTCVLRPFSREKLGKTNDSDTHAVVGELSLKHMAFADSGMIQYRADPA